MTWQNITCLPLLEEVDAADIVGFEENKLFTLLNNWFQQRTNPCNKSEGPTLEKVELFKSLFENEKRDFHS